MLLHLEGLSVCCTIPFVGAYNITSTESAYSEIRDPTVEDMDRYECVGRCRHSYPNRFNLNADPDSAESTLTTW